MAFKLAIVEQVEKGEMSYKQAQARFGIQGRSTVLTWLRKHGRLDWTTGASTLTRNLTDMTEPPLTPEQRIKELEQQLAQSQVKAEFFEAVINVLQKEYGVRIIKKHKHALSKTGKSKGFQ
jgi:transposase-like protein